MGVSWADSCHPVVSVLFLRNVQAAVDVVIQVAPDVDDQVTAHELPKQDDEQDVFDDVHDGAEIHVEAEEEVSHIFSPIEFIQNH